MHLEGKEWENYSYKDGTKSIGTFSLVDLLENIESAINNYKRNGIDPNEVPVLIKFDRKIYSIPYISQLPSNLILESDPLYELVFTAPDSKPEVGEYWSSRGPSYNDCSGFIKSKKAGERMLRMVRYVLDKDEVESWLDFREYEPDWIQFKFVKSEFNLEKLDKLSRENGGIITEDILKESKL